MKYDETGKRIREIRMVRKFTQEHVAELAGIKPEVYQDIESGKRRITLEMLVNIANALHVATDILLQDSLEFKVEHHTLSKPDEDALA